MSTAGGDSDEARRPGRRPLLWGGAAVAVVALVAGVVAYTVGSEDDGEATNLLLDCTEPEVAPPPPTREVDALADAELAEVLGVHGAVGVAPDPVHSQLWVAIQQGGVLVHDLETPRPNEATDNELASMADLEDQIVVDLRGQVAEGYEQGVLDVAVDPEGTELFVHYNGVDDATNVVAYPLQDGEVVEGEERLLVHLDQPLPTHNGGGLRFGPDGLLYLALGDGGFSPVDVPDAPDFSANAQDLSSPFGAILRLDPDAQDEDAAVPADNPFADEPGLAGGIWVSGARNPFSFAFDDETGDLWVADVGQHCWEEINVLPADDDGLDAGRGENLGWPWLEGRHRYQQDPPHDDHVLPVHTYATGDEGCAVIGGTVYRGSLFDDLDGWYVFGDNCTPELQALRVAEDGTVELRELGVSVERLASIEADADGELLVTSMFEGIERLEPADRG